MPLSNKRIRIEHGEVILHKLNRVPPSADLTPLHTLLQERLPKVNIPDLLPDPDHGIGWTQQRASRSRREAEHSDLKNHKVPTSLSPGYGPLPQVFDALERNGNLSPLGVMAMESDA